MRKFMMPLIAIILLLMPIGGYARSNLLSVGKTTDVNLVVIDGEGVYKGGKSDYRVITTDDTLVATQSSLTVINRGAATLALPSAVLGLEFTAINGDTGDILSLDSAATDTIDYLTLDAGDELDSSGTKGDSITVICGRANTWYVKSINGVWQDGGHQ